MKPGIYQITSEQYHGGAGTNKSLLDLVRVSPAHARHAMTAANDNQPTAAQSLGSALHSLVLEPDDFAARYVKAPKFDRRTKDGKAAAAAFEAEHAGKTPVDEETWAQLHAMRDAVLAHPAARALLTEAPCSAEVWEMVKQARPEAETPSGAPTAADGAPGVSELSVYWIDASTGELCRCRPDYWRTDGILVDLKSTNDASPEAFASSIAGWRYHVQHAYYLDGCREAVETGHAPKGWKTPQVFAFIAVEKSAPHHVGVYIIGTDDEDLGRVQYREDLETLAQCLT